MKKILSLVLVLVMILSSVPAFADVNTAGDTLAGYGVIKGDGTGLNPDGELNRQDALIILVRLLGVEEEALKTTVKPSFTDVTNEYYHPYIAYAEINGLTKGIGGGLFGFGQKATTGMIATFMVRALGYEADTLEAGLAKAKELKILDGVTAGDDAVITRGETFVAMVNTLNLPQKGETTALKYVLKFETAPVAAELKLESAKADNLEEVFAMFTTEIDKDSLDKANFTIDGTAATKVVLQADKKTVVATFALANQTEYTLKVATIKDAAGKELKDAEATFTANDFTAPMVEKVEVTGNKKLTITFSEPVQDTTSNVLGNYKINDKLFGGTVTTDGRVVTINLTSRLADGVHTVVVNSNVTDIAGYKLVANKNEIAVAKDETKPAVAEVVSATQTKVVVKFTEAVEDTFSVSATVGTFSSKSTDDNITYTLNFTVAGALPLSGTEISLKDVTDYYGNKDTIKVNVVPTIDLVRPEVESIEQKTQTTLHVTFNKNVDNTTGAVVTKTTGDSPSTLAAPTWAYYVDGDAKTHKDVIVLTYGTALANKEHSVEIKGFEDLTPLMNVSVPSTQLITIKDMVKPEVSSVDVNLPTATATGALYVTFNEKVDATTATTKGNYAYVLDSKPVSLGAGHTLSVLSDSKTVKIVLPKGAATTLSSITIEDVKDEAGNKMTAAIVTTINPYVAAPPTVSSPVATAKNKVVLTVSAGINPATVTASDFVLESTTTAGSMVYVVNAEYSADDNEITLTLNENLGKDAMWNAGNVKVKVIAQNLKNIYGEKIALNANVGTVGDQIAPEATKLASATFTGTTTGSLALVVEIDEDLAAYTWDTVDAANYVVVIGGVKYAVTNVVTAAATTEAKAKVTLTIGSVPSSVVGKTVKVNYYAAPTLDDANNNQLKSYEFTATIR